MAAFPVLRDDGMVSEDRAGGEYVHTSWVSCSTGLPAPLVHHCGMDNAVGIRKAGVVIVERRNDLGDKKDIV